MGHETNSFGYDPEGLLIEEFQPTVHYASSISEWRNRRVFSWRIPLGFQDPSLGLQGSSQDKIHHLHNQNSVVYHTHQDDPSNGYSRGHSEAHTLLAQHRVQENSCACLALFAIQQ